MSVFNRIFNTVQLISSLRQIPSSTTYMCDLLVGGST